MITAADIAMPVKPVEVVIASKTGNGGFVVSRYAGRWQVQFEGYGVASYADAQRAADACREWMHDLRGTMTYFSAANALEAILENSEAW